MPQIQEVHQDIIQFIEDFEILNKDNDKTLVVIHQANCFNTLKNARGIAGVLGTSYPQIAVADDETRKGDENKLGTYTKAHIHDRLVIFNAYGQYSYGMDPNNVYTRYNRLESALEAIKEFSLMTLTNPVFLMPKNIGSGLANGNYDIIRNTIIESLYSDTDCTLIYK